MKPCIISEDVNSPPETGITRKLRVMLALQKPKSVFENFKNNNRSATSGHKLARILQTLEAFIINSGRFSKVILIPYETIKCLDFDGVNFISKNCT